MSFSMYTTIPMPNIQWEEKRFPYVITSLPLVGFIIGLIWFFGTNILNKLLIPVTIKTVLVCLIPLFLSGFIHIDGYMDTCDAIFSRASLEKKYKILKDSCVGAFAVIGLLIISFLYYVSIYEVLKQGNKYNSINIYTYIFKRNYKFIYYKN